MFAPEEATYQMRGRPLVGRLPTVGFASEQRGYRTFELGTRYVRCRPFLARTGRSAFGPVTDHHLSVLLSANHGRGEETWATQNLIPQL